MDHPLVHVTAVELLGGGGRRVRLSFDDGASVVRDLTGLLLHGPVFDAARTDAGFATVFLDVGIGTIAWPGGADIDPGVLRFDDLFAEVSALTQ